MAEAQAHAKLSRWRLRGEWFRPDSFVLRELSTWTWVDEVCLTELLNTYGEQGGLVVLREGERPDRSGVR
jgi:hypothetical protein